MEPEVPKERKRYRKREEKRETSGYIGGFFAIIMIVGIFFGLKYFSGSEAEVAGVKTDAVKEAKELEVKSKAKENVKGELNEKIENIKTQINDLNAVDVTTKSPQVQKIISDLQSLQNLPKDQARNACEQICTTFK